MNNSKLTSYIFDPLLLWNRSAKNSEKFLKNSFILSPFSIFWWWFCLEVKLNKKTSNSNENTSNWNKFRQFVYKIRQIEQTNVKRKIPSKWKIPSICFISAKLIKIRQIKKDNCQIVIKCPSKCFKNMSNFRSLIVMK